MLFTRFGLHSMIRWDSDIEVRTGLHTVTMQDDSVIGQLNNFYLRDRRVKVGIGVVIARNHYSEKG